MKPRAMKRGHASALLLLSLIAILSRESKITACELASELSHSSSVNVCSRTIIRRLAELGLFCRVACVKYHISKKNRVARLAFARKYIDKPSEFWHSGKRTTTPSIRHVSLKNTSVATRSTVSNGHLKALINPIEHLWDHEVRRLNPERFRSEEALFSSLQEAWNILDLDMMQTLISSMPRRLQAVIDNDSYPTKY